MIFIPPEITWCIGAQKTKTVRVPTVASENRGTQTLLADKLSASFKQKHERMSTHLGRAAIRNLAIGHVYA